MFRILWVFIQSPRKGTDFTSRSENDVFSFVLAQVTTLYFEFLLHILALYQSQVPGQV